MKTPTWDDLIADRSLCDLPYKIETNRYHKILMSPASAWHGNFEHEIGYLLRQLLPDGKIINEAPVLTEDGVRVADVGWMSRERWQPNKRCSVLPIAPEICVEILSPSNTRAEMLEKMNLYYAMGAQEIWLCDQEGTMEFFTAASLGQPCPTSVLCPAFPKTLDLD